MSSFFRIWKRLKMQPLLLLRFLPGSLTTRDIYSNIDKEHGSVQTIGKEKKSDVK